jgi:VWFA-related protein
VLACVLLCASLDAQTPSPTSVPQPTFRAGTTLVEVSAVVTRDGQPVTDLRAEDFTVLDNGQPQPLVVFEPVDLGRGESPAQRRDFVLVIDDLHIAARHVPQALAVGQAVIDALGPHDRLAVLTTGRDDQRLDFTTDRAAAAATVARVRAFGGPNVPFELDHRARTAMAVLRAVAAGVRGDAAERRSIVLVSEGHALPFDEPRLDDYRLAWAEYLAVLREAALSNVAIYAIDPRGLRVIGPAADVPSRHVVGVPSGDITSGVGRDIVPATTYAGVVSGTQVLAPYFGSLGTLSLNTGGLLTTARNDLTVDVPRMLRDSRQYYRLAYVQPDPPPGKKQPRTRSIKVQVSRPGLEVRARQRYAPT